MRSDVEALAGGIGPRTVSISVERIRRAEIWIIDRLRDAGVESSRDEVDINGPKLANIVVVLPGRDHPDEIVIIGAHYDTVVESPGANDNASGVALLLAAVRQLRLHPLSRTVRVVFFVNEESPFSGGIQMGSRVYADRCAERGDNIVAMIAIDSIGYYTDEPDSQTSPRLIKRVLPTTGNFVAFFTNDDNETFLDRVVAIFQEHAHFPTVGLASGSKQLNVSDHAPFLWRGYPALLMTDTSSGRDPNYHRPTDTPDKLDYDAMARVADGFIETVRKLAATK